MTPDYDHIILAVAALATLMVIAWLVIRGRGTERYERRARLFSPAERRFHGVLHDSVSDRYHVFGKVRVADVITPVSSLPRGDWQRAFNRVSAKHFDFVLCEHDSLAIVCAIELDDRSHERRDRRRRDAFLNAACRSADMPLVRFPVSRSYDASEVRAAIARSIERGR